MIASLVNGLVVKYIRKDRLHQVQRNDNEYDTIMDKLNNLQVRSFLSGAGPTIMAIANKNDII